MFSLRSNIKKLNIKKVWLYLTKFHLNSVTICYLSNINYLKSSLKIKSYWAISLTKLCFRRQNSLRDVWWFLGESRAPDRKSGSHSKVRFFSRNFVEKRRWMAMKNAYLINIVISSNKWMLFIKIIKNLQFKEISWKIHLIMRFYSREF